MPLRTCATKICSASASLWPTSDLLATCGGRNDSTELRATVGPAGTIFLMQFSDSELVGKESKLRDDLRQVGRLLVAYSGGVDSAYLAWAAHRALGSDMLAVIADSPSLARTHLADATAFAEEHGIPIEVVST